MDLIEANRSRRSIVWTALITALTALAAVGTMVIRIPIPATTGYFNIGDVFVVLAGLWLGPMAGMVVGAIGPTVADAVGYPQFILATLVTKGLEGLVVGLIGGSGKRIHIRRRVAGATLGVLVMVAGYFCFEAFIYPAIGRIVPFFAVTDLGAAIVEIGPNLIQAFIGASVGLGLWKAVSGYDVRGDVEGTSDVRSDP